MEQTKVFMLVLLALVLFAMGSIVAFDSGVTAFAVEGDARERGLNYWPIIAGMTGVAAIGALALSGLLKR